MQIQKIKLSNFRNFKNCELEFSNDKEKNFTIVLGQNTYGKTTLVKAFVWCLYRINLFDNKILLNSDIASSMRDGETEKCSVEINLFHKGCNYKITTRESYCINSSGNLSICLKASTNVLKVVDNNTITIPSINIEEEIDNILRSDLKEYFFFDGESNSIDSIATKKNLTDAVSNILGLSNIKNLKEYFDPNKSESVSARLSRELIHDESIVLDGLVEKRDELINKLEGYEDRKKEILNELEVLEKQRIENENLLDANRDVQKYQKEKRDVEADILKFKKLKEDDMSSLIKMINTKNAYLKVLFGKAYLKFDLKKIRENSSFNSSDSYAGITESAVDQIIKQGKCICGCEIKEGSEAYKHLILAREHMEPHDFGKYIEDFDGCESANVYNASSIFENIDSKAKGILDLIESIDNSEDRLKTIKEHIEGRIDTGIIQKRIDDINQQIGSQKNSLKYIEEQDIPNCEINIENINEKIKKSEITDKRNDFTNLCIKYATYIYSIADDRMRKSKIKIREKLEEEVKGIFNSMYHGNRNIKINDDFKAETVVVSAGKDQKIDGSTGLGTVVNYSFVAGLMNLAKKAIINDDEDDISDPELENETYPLVMDAPFSNTDEVHIKNICNALPNYCDQIIMFVMEKDFNYARDSIKDKIGKIYKLEQISETESNVKEIR